MSKILAFDLGTTFFKTALFDRSGRLCDVSRIAPPAESQGGRMEMAADAFLDAIARGIAGLRERVDGRLGDVDAVTFATQTNSFVLLDAAHNPLTPIILWPDVRAAEFEAEVCRRSDIPGFAATTGIPQLGAEFMVAKLLWLQDHSTEIWRKTAKICLLSDYFTFLLTGQFVTEAGAAGLTGLVDIHRCQWWSEMLERFDLDDRRLPSIVRAGADLGPILPSIASQFGLSDSCRFVVGCLDQYAGAIGAGNVAPGMMSETTGTVLATVRCADCFAASPGTQVFQGPAFREGLYWQMAFGSVSANYLQWYRDQLPDRPEFSDLGALAEAIAPGADGLKLKTDAPMTSCESVFNGIGQKHTRGHFVRCIMEAVADALRGQAAALCDGPLPREIRCAGGAARSDVWLQIKADRTGIDTVATLCEEPTSLGAAILAEVALRTRESGGNAASADVEEVARQWVSLRPPHHVNR